MKRTPIDAEGKILRLSMRRLEATQWTSKNHLCLTRETKKVSFGVQDLTASWAKSLNLLGFSPAHVAWKQRLDALSRNVTLTVTRKVTRLSAR